MACQLAINHFSSASRATLDLGRRAEQPISWACYHCPLHCTSSNHPARHHLPRHRGASRALHPVSDSRCVRSSHLLPAYLNQTDPRLWRCAHPPSFSASRLESMTDFHHRHPSPCALRASLHRCFCLSPQNPFPTTSQILAPTLLHLLTFRSATVIPQLLLAYVLVS